MRGMFSRGQWTLVLGLLLAASWGCGGSGAGGSEGNGITEEGKADGWSGTNRRPKIVFLNLLDDPELEGKITCYDTGCGGSQSQVRVVLTKDRIIELSKYDLDTQATKEHFKKALTARLLQLDAELRDRFDIHLVIAGHHTSRFYGTRCLLPGPAADRCTRGAALELYPEDLAAVIGQEELARFRNNVRHLYLLGCNTTWYDKANAWRAPFPQVRSVSGYTGTDHARAYAAAFFDISYQTMRSKNLCTSDPEGVLLELESWLTARETLLGWPSAKGGYIPYDCYPGQQSCGWSKNTPFPACTAVSPACKAEMKSKPLGFSAACREAFRQGCDNYNKYGWLIVSRCEGAAEALYYHSPALPIDQNRTPEDVLRAWNAYRASQVNYAHYLAADPGFEDVPRNTGPAADELGATPRGHYLAILGLSSVLAMNPEAVTTALVDWPVGVSVAAMIDRLDNDLTGERPRAIRLVLFHDVVAAWAKKYPELAQWLVANGRLPDGSAAATPLAELPRRQVLDLVESLAQVPSELTDAAQRAAWTDNHALVQAALRDLDPRYTED